MTTTKNAAPKTVSVNTHNSEKMEEGIATETDDSNSVLKIRNVIKTCLSESGIKDSDFLIFKNSYINDEGSYYNKEIDPQFYEGTETDWNALSKVSLPLNESIISKTVKLEGVWGTLKSYFNSTPQTKKWENKTQEFEYSILKEHFNIHKDKYYSFPFKKENPFRNVVHIIFKENFEKVFKEKASEIRAAVLNKNK